jgi:hypothetical protein
MKEEIIGSRVFINGVEIDQIAVAQSFELTPNEETYFVKDFNSEIVQKSLNDSDLKTYKFLFSSVYSENLNQIKNISSNRYVWIGLIKDNATCPVETMRPSNLRYYRQYDLLEVDVDYLLKKWNEQYIESEYLQKKTDAIKNHFLQSLDRFQNYKDHFIVKKGDVIVANLSVKYFFYNLAQAECSAIHMWIDQNTLDKIERKYIHSIFMKEIERINKVSQMFCGIAYENIKALRNIERYGFKPYFMESKKYE